MLDWFAFFQAQAAIFGAICSGAALIWVAASADIDMMKRHGNTPAAWVSYLRVFTGFLALSAALPLLVLAFLALPL